ncbi:hypothetical protein ACFL4H_00230 [Candidatus Neomarinimicrobiota bacterium]
MEYRKLTGFDKIKGLSKRAKKYLYDMAEALYEHRDKTWLKSYFFMAEYGVSGTEVRAMIHSLRVDYEYPIISSQKGYQWTEDWKKIDATIQHLQERINSTQDVLTAITLTELKMKREM